MPLLGRQMRQTPIAQSTDSHLYYRSLEFALERCQLTLLTDTPEEKEVAFEHLARLTQEGLALFSSHSPLGSVFKSIANELHKNANTPLTPAWLTVTPDENHIGRQEVALVRLHKHLKEIRKIAKILPTDSVLNACLETIAQEKNNAYYYICSIGSTLETKDTSYHLIDSACREINTQYQAYEEMNKKHRTLKVKHEEKATYQTILVEKYPVTLKYFSVKNRDLLLQEQSAITLLLNEIQEIWDITPLTEELLTTWDEKLSEIEKRQTAYAISYNDAQEFLVENTQKNKRAAAILGFNYHFSSCVHTNRQLSSNTFDKDFTTQSLKDAYRKSIVAYHPDKNAGQLLPPWDFIDLPTTPSIEENTAMVFEHTAFTKKVAYVRQGKNLFYAIQPGILNCVSKEEQEMIFLSSDTDILTHENRAKLLAHHQKNYWKTYFLAIQDSYKQLNEHRLGIIQWIPCKGRETPINIHRVGYVDILSNELHEVVAEENEKIKIFEEWKILMNEKINAAAEGRITLEQRIKTKEEQTRSLEEGIDTAIEERKSLEERLKATEIQLAQALTSMNVQVAELSAIIKANPSLLATQQSTTTTSLPNAVAETTPTVESPSSDIPPLIWTQSQKVTVFQNNTTSQSAATITVMNDELAPSEEQSACPLNTSAK